MLSMANTQRRVTLPLEPAIWEFLEKRLLVVINARAAKLGKPPVPIGHLIAALVTNDLLANKGDIIREYAELMGAVSHLEFGASVSPDVVAGLTGALGPGGSQIARSRTRGPLAPGALRTSSVLPPRASSTRTSRS